MSITTPLERLDDPAPVDVGGRLVTAPLAKVLVASFGAMCSFYLMLSVMPMVAASNGADGAAGLATGLLMLAGVAAELCSTRLLRRYGDRAVLHAGLVLLGVPALALVASDHVATMMTISVARGFGLGLTVVASGSIVVALLPERRRGEGLGLFGVVNCVPAIAALPAGVWIADGSGAGTVFVLAAVLAVAPLSLYPGPPAAQLRPCDDEAPAGPGRLLTSVRRLGLGRLSLIFAATTLAGGAVVAFLPVTAPNGHLAVTGLFVQATAATVARWLAGRSGDRHGHDRLLIPALVASAVGVTAFAVAADLASVVVAAVVFGGGFGVLQSATLAAMVERAPRSEYGTVNAVWNVAYDFGYGVGPIAFGLLAATSSDMTAFAATATVIVLAIPAAHRSTRARPSRNDSRQPTATLATAA
jgi:MFS family permease